MGEKARDMRDKLGWMPGLAIAGAALLATIVGFVTLLLTPGENPVMPPVHPDRSCGIEDDGSGASETESRPPASDVEENKGEPGLDKPRPADLLSSLSLDFEYPGKWPASTFLLSPDRSSVLHTSRRRRGWRFDRILDPASIPQRVPDPVPHGIRHPRDGFFLPRFQGVADLKGLKSEPIAQGRFDFQPSAFFVLDGGKGFIVLGEKR